MRSKELPEGLRAVLNQLEDQASVYCPAINDALEKSASIDEFQTRVKDVMNDRIRDAEKIKIAVQAVSGHKIIALMDAAFKIQRDTRELTKQGNYNQVQAGIEASTGLKKIIQELNKIRDEVKASGQSVEPVDEALASVQIINKEIVSKYFGITL